MNDTERDPTVRPSIRCDELGCKERAEWKVTWFEEGFEGTSNCCTNHVGENCHTDMETTVTPLH